MAKILRARSGVESIGCGGDGGAGQPPYVPGAGGARDLLAGIRVNLPEVVETAKTPVPGPAVRPPQRLPWDRISRRHLLIGGIAFVVLGGLVAGGVFGYQLWRERVAAAELAAAAPAPAPAPVTPDVLVGIKWVRVDGGGFQMGSSTGQRDERPAHFVTIPTFEMSATEVTIAQYLKCVDAGVCTAPHFDDGTCRVLENGIWAARILPQRFRGMDNPIVCVDWEQASTFARWVGGRLPAESEWEYAVRAGFSGDLYGAVGDVAWYAGNSNGSTHPVGAKRPNVLGLYDMMGNVWEHCQDWYHENYAGAPSDQQPWTYPATSRRVNRGSSWDDGGSVIRMSNRYSLDPGRNSCSLGIRVARDLK